MKKQNTILIISAALLISVLSAGTLLTGNRAFSENENRYLQEKPSFSFETLLSGRFATQTENYLTDQILGREKWISAVSRTESTLGIKDINGVYLCKDGRIVEKRTQRDFDRAQYEKNLRKISRLSAALKRKNIPLNLMMVPTAAYIYRAQLPGHADCFNEDAAFADAAKALPKSHSEGFIDLRSTFKKASEKDVFFRTDHHWTGYGAFLAYQQFSCRIEKNRSSVSFRDYKPKTLATDFRGTLYSKVLMDVCSPDVIETAAEEKGLSYTVSISDKTYGSLYFNEYLKKKDKYAVYFGGNFDRVDIDVKPTETVSPANTSPAKKENKEKRILILKDSFANSFVPYLLKDYRHITMVDTRYYSGNIAQLAENYDRVLLLYSVFALSEQKLNLTETLLQ